MSLKSLLHLTSILFFSLSFFLFLKKLTNILKSIDLWNFFRNFFWKKKKEFFFLQIFIFSRKIVSKLFKNGLLTNAVKTLVNRTFFKKKKIRGDSIKYQHVMITNIFYSEAIFLDKRIEKSWE